LVDKIKIFYADDEHLKKLGELLSTDLSRSIIRLLVERPHYTNEIATKLKVSVSLIIHHLKKIEALGLVEITNKKIVRKGIDRRFFEIKSDIFISKLDKEKAEKDGILKRIFKDGIKFASISIIGLSSWGGTQLVYNSIKPKYPPPNLYDEIVIKIPYDVAWSIAVAGIVMSISILLLFLKKRKNDDD